MQRHKFSSTPSSGYSHPSPTHQTSTRYSNEERQDYNVDSYSSQVPGHAPYNGDSGGTYVAERQETANMPRTRGNTPPSRGSSQGDDLYSVRVVLRCRPLNETERTRGDQEVVNVTNDKQIQVLLPGPGERQAQREYSFNHIFGTNCQQDEVFQYCGIKDLLNSAIDGYAATVFAYGQTGSGKTYSMSGVEERIVRDEWEGGEKTDGIIPRAIQYLFDAIATRSRQYNITTRASYCEIYNEQVFDLLNMSNTSLPVRWNAASGFFVQDLFVVECRELSDVMAVVSEGQRNRRVGSHQLNKDSSRSHSILTVHVETELIDPDDGHTTIKYGKLVFVDLAGSERLKDTKSAGITLTETGAINKSLFTLSKVISSLSDRKKARTGFVPYRDSKLTKLLMDSLGGNCLTLMIACCSPSSIYLEETLNTLNYAMRAKCIQNKPMVHMDPKEQLIFSLKQDVKLLRMENSYFRQQLGYHPDDAVTIPQEFQDMTSPRSKLIPGSSSKDGTVSSQSFTHLPSVSSERLGYRTPGTHSPSRYSKPTVSGGATMISPPPGLGVPTSGPRSTPSPRVRGVTMTPLSHTPGIDQATLQPIMTAYQTEIERLRGENSELRSKGGYAERSYRAVMSENERLSRKLEHLEEIFVQKGKNTPWPVSRDGEEQNRSGEVDKSSEHAQPIVGKLTAEEQQQLQEQNARLNAVVKGLTVENSMMVKRIKLMEHSIMQQQTR